MISMNAEFVRDFNKFEGFDDCSTNSCSDINCACSWECTSFHPEVKAVGTNYQKFVGWKPWPKPYSIW